MRKDNFEFSYMSKPLLSYNIQRCYGIVMADMFASEMVEPQPRFAHACEYVKRLIDADVTMNLSDYSSSIISDIGDIVFGSTRELFPKDDKSFMRMANRVKYEVYQATSSTTNIIGRYVRSVYFRKKLLTPRLGLYCVSHNKLQLSDLQRETALDNIQELIMSMFNEKGFDKFAQDRESKLNNYLCGNLDNFKILDRAVYGARRFMLNGDLNDEGYSILSDLDAQKGFNGTEKIHDECMRIFRCSDLIFGMRNDGTYDTHDNIFSAYIVSKMCDAQHAEYLRKRMKPLSKSDIVHPTEWREMSRACNATCDAATYTRNMKIAQFFYNIAENGDSYEQVLESIKNYLNAAKYHDRLLMFKLTGDDRRIYINNSANLSNLVDGFAGLSVVLQDVTDPLRIDPKIFSNQSRILRINTAGDLLFYSNVNVEQCKDAKNSVDDGLLPNLTVQYEDDNNSYETEGIKGLCRDIQKKNTTMLILNALLTSVGYYNNGGYLPEEISVDADGTMTVTPKLAPAELYKELKSRVDPKLPLGYSDEFLKLATYKTIHPDNWYVPGMERLFNIIDKDELERVLDSINTAYSAIYDRYHWSNYDVPDFSVDIGALCAGSTKHTKQMTNYLFAHYIILADSDVRCVLHIDIIKNMVRALVKSMVDDLGYDVDSDRLCEFYM